jgi:hypothetical protein
VCNFPKKIVRRARHPGIHPATRPHADLKHSTPPTNCPHPTTSPLPNPKRSTNHYQVTNRQYDVRRRGIVLNQYPIWPIRSYLPNTNNRHPNMANTTELGGRGVLSFPISGTVLYRNMPNTRSCTPLVNDNNS